MQNNKSILLILLLLVLIIFISMSKTKSSFGDTYTQTVTVASSDIVSTTFVLQKLTFCNPQAAICDQPIYTVITTPIVDPTPLQYRSDISGYFDYLKANTFTANINVFHCNIINTLNDYQGQGLAENIITGLGSIQCSYTYNIVGIANTDERINLQTLPGSIPPQTVTMNTGDLLIASPDRYIDCNLYNRATVYQFVDMGPPEDVPCTTIDKCNAGDSNFIWSTFCGKCNLDLILNGVVQTSELPMLTLNNGVAFDSYVTDCINHNGEPSYLIPNLFANNPVMSYGSLSVNFKEFVGSFRAIAGGQGTSYITRIDGIKDGNQIVVYYTTLQLDTTGLYIYSSDSCYILSSDWTNKIGNIHTNSDGGNRLSNKKIFVSYSGPSDTVNPYAHLIFSCTDGGVINVDAGNPDDQKIDYNFLRIKILCGIVVYINGATGGSWKYGCGFDNTDISDSVNNLSYIYCNVYHHDVMYMVIEVNFLDSTRNLIKQYRCSA